MITVVVASASPLWASQNLEDSETAQAAALKEAKASLEKEIVVYNEIVRSINDVVLDGVKDGGTAVLSVGATYGSFKLFLRANNYIVQRGNMGQKLRARAGHFAWILAVAGVLASSGSSVTHGTKFVLAEADFLRLSKLLVDQRQVLLAQQDVINSLSSNAEEWDFPVAEVSTEINNYLEESAASDELLSEAIVKQRALIKQEVQIHNHLVEQISQAEVDLDARMVKIAISGLALGGSMAGAAVKAHSLRGDLRIGNVAYLKSGSIIIGTLGAVAIASAVVMKDQWVKLDVSYEEMSRLIVQLQNKKNELDTRYQTLRKLENAVMWEHTPKELIVLDVPEDLDLIHSIESTR